MSHQTGPRRRVGASARHANSSAESATADRGRGLRPPAMRTRLLRLSLAPFVMAALVVGFNACSSRSDSGLVEVIEIEQCSEYAAAVRACMQKLGVGDSDEQAAAMKRSFSRVAKNESSREKLTQGCTESARRVRESCR